MDVLGLVGLTPLMALTSGRPEIAIALIDGPVNIDHPDFAPGVFREVASSTIACTRKTSAACLHGTLVAGILSACRGSAAPAICPDCTVLVRPIFPEASEPETSAPATTPEELAAAIIDVIEAGANIINLSVGLLHPTTVGIAHLHAALDYATRRNVICVAAAGNQGEIGGSSLTSHPWVIPVAACDANGRPFAGSNFGRSIGRGGVLAPGTNILSLGPSGGRVTFGGTSAAAPFVTGALALIWSLIPTAHAADLRFALTNPTLARRRSIVPPLLDAWGAYQRLAARSNYRFAS